MTQRGRLPADKQLDLQRRRARIKLLAKTHTARMISEEMMIPIHTVENDLGWHGIRPRKANGTKADALVARHDDPNNSRSKRITAAEMDDWDTMKKQGYSALEIAAAMGRPDLITPKPPKLVPSKFGGKAYDPADLLRFFSEARRRGMKESSIALLLKVPLHRVAYLETDGLRFIERKLST